MKTLVFTKRNLLELIRNPLLYIFSFLFPIVMLILFVIIKNNINTYMPLFELNSLIPGIIMFSFSFITLMVALLISKDKSQAFLKRLFTSPLKAKSFIIGYFIPYLIIGIIQEIICILTGYIIATITKEAYMSVLSSICLSLEMLPLLAINILLGIIIGITLSDKSAPAITSIFISISGILGGAWMPLDSMKKLESISGYFPFYASVYLGRIITKAYHTPINQEDYLNPIIYSFNPSAIKYIIVIGIYLLVLIISSIFIFKKMMKSDN